MSYATSEQNIVFITDDYGVYTVRTYIILRFMTTGNVDLPLLH